MTGVKSLDRFLEFFNSNAGGVFSTITNQTIAIEPTNYSPFSMSELKDKIGIPCVLLTINFIGSKEFSVQVATPTDVVASFSDLMMLGTGEAEYVAEEHNDAVQEMFNQALGSLTTELDSEGIQAQGSVSEVAASDLEIHSEFLEGSKMVELTFGLLGKTKHISLLFDTAAMNVIEELFTATSQEPLFSTAGLGTPPKQDQGPVSVSRASFAEIQEVRPSNTKGTNIDILLDINLPITVELGRKDMRIKEILELGQGSVVELNKLAGDLVDLMINGKKFAVGEVMVVDENYAVRVVNLISREERIRTLGPE
jgi:flagellar motor switch protein FliN/FliY